LPHGEEEQVSAARGYDYPSIHVHLQAQGTEDWVAIKAKPGHVLDEWTKGLNTAIARIRAIGAPLQNREAAVWLPIKNDCSFESFSNGAAHTRGFHVKCSL
jgi:hypothetical protein